MDGNGTLDAQELGKLVKDLTPFQPHFNPISPHFNPTSTPFQPHFRTSTLKMAWIAP